MENHHLHNFHFLRTLKSQPVKKTDGGEFRHPDIPCFQVIRVFDIRCLIAFQILKLSAFDLTFLGELEDVEMQFFFLTNLVRLSNDGKH